MYTVLIKGAGKVIRGWDVGIRGNYLSAWLLFYFPVGHLTSIWQIIIFLFTVGMRVGEKRRLIVPPAMWYTFDILCLFSPVYTSLEMSYIHISFSLLMDVNLFCSSGGKSVVEVPKNSSVIYEIELVKVK